MKIGSLKLRILLLVLPVGGVTTLWACDDTGPSPIGVHPDDPEPTTTAGDDGGDASTDAEAEDAEVDAPSSRDAGDAGSARDAGDAGDGGDADADAR